MRVTLSAAVTADGYLDDTTPQRLIVSTPEDWAAVYALRSEHDAILVGAETLRRDNPSLLIRDEQQRIRRRAEGLHPDIAKVTVTASGKIDPRSKFFTEGDAEHYVFSPTDIPELKDIATVISTGTSITAKAIVTALERHGINRLLVEGGAQMLTLFLAEGMADRVRLAVNPTLHIGPKRGGARFAFEIPEGMPCVRETLGAMEVVTCTLHPDTTETDLKYLRTAIAQGCLCTPSTTSYCVGAVVVTADGQTFTGYTHETSPTHHAEQEAIAKALAEGVSLCGAAIYISMEPCTTRSSEPESCTQLILRHGFKRVVFAYYEPDCFVQCRGAMTLREEGVEVRVYPSLAKEVQAVNAHILT